VLWLAWGVCSSLRYPIIRKDKETGKGYIRLEGVLSTHAQEPLAETQAALVHVCECGLRNMPTLFSDLMFDGGQITWRGTPR